MCNALYLYCWNTLNCVLNQFPMISIEFFGENVQTNFDLWWKHLANSGN